MAEIPRVLYRFLPLDAALEALEHGTLAWYSPAVLSGPYRFSEHTPIGFDKPSFHKYLVKYLLQLLFAPDDPRGNPNNPILKAVKRWRSENRFTDEEEAVDALNEITRTMVDTHFEKINGFFERWRNTATRQRILPLSADIASLHAWDVLTQGHRGVALRLKVGEENVVSAPKKVLYRSVPTYITSLREQIKVMLGDEAFPEDTEQEFESRCLCQPKEYNYRREWRCFRYTEEPEAELRVPLQSADLSGVFFGLGLTEDEKKKLVAVAGSKFPKLKIFDSSTKVLEFAIDFKPWVKG